MFLENMSDHEQKMAKEKLASRQELILTTYHMIVKASVQGFLAIEDQVYDYQTEPDLVKRYFKRSVDLILSSKEMEDIKKIQDFDKSLLLNSQILTDEQIELLFLIDSIIPALYEREVAKLFFHAKFANMHLMTIPFDSKIVKYIVLEIEKLKTSILQGTTDYPIKRRLGYEEFKESLDEKMEIFRNMGDRKIQFLIRETQSTDLERILGLCDVEIKNKIVKNISQRAAEMLLEDIENRFYELDDTPITFEQIQESLDTFLTTLSNMENE